MQQEGDSYTEALSQFFKKFPVRFFQSKSNHFITFCCELDKDVDLAHIDMTLCIKICLV